MTAASLPLISHDEFHGYQRPDVKGLSTNGGTSPFRPESRTSGMRPTISTVLRWALSDALADHVFFGAEILFGERLVHDGNLGRTLAIVAQVEIAAAQQWDFQRGEIRRIDVVPARRLVASPPLRYSTTSVAIA